VKRLCIQGPTGCGKTITFKELARREIESGGRVVIYTNRKTIRSQISEVLEDHRIWHGIRAAGYSANLNRPVQVSSIMTERVRSLGEESRWSVHDATLVIVDEAHSQKGQVARKLLAMHLREGAFITGWTATPVGIGDMYDEMITMASLAELRKTGVLVHCDVYAPDEVSMQGIRVAGGEFNLGQARQRVRETLVFGKVIEHWERLNPGRKQTVLFAPGVKESRWFCEQFLKLGFKAGHVDAKTSERERAELFEKWSTGEIEVVCNFGVLREGFDLKCCQHAILCQPTNRISTYLQIAGRVLRSSNGKSRCTLQDHVGAYWRHGSPNDDRSWDLLDTDKRICNERKTRKERSEEPIICPNCKAVMFYVPGFGPGCPYCGHQNNQKTKEVRQTGEQLVRVSSTGKKGPSVDSVLKRSIYVGINKNLLASQVMAMASKKLGRWPKQHQTNILLPRPGGQLWNQRANEVWLWAEKWRKK
jgi:superfamily II DNA or RNA helicase